MRLKHAIALQNVGNFDAAIAILEELQSSLPDTNQRARIACRLAVACCDAGQLVSAGSHLQIAQRSPPVLLRPTRAMTSLRAKLKLPGEPSLELSRSEIRIKRH